MMRWRTHALILLFFFFLEILLKHCNISSYLRDRQLYDRPWNSNCHLVVLLWTVTPSLTNEARYTVRGRHIKANYAVTLALMCLFILRTAGYCTSTYRVQAIISLYNINLLVFITETESVYCAVRPASLYIIRLISAFQGFNVSYFLR